MLCAADGTAIDVAEDSARVEEKAQDRAGDKASRAKIRAANSKHRHIRSSYRSNIIIGLKVFVLFGLAAGYFLSSFFIERAEFEHQAALMPEHTLLARRNTVVRDTTYVARQMALMPVLQQDFRPEDPSSVAGKLLHKASSIWTIMY